jgi:hypothetical protein
MAIVFRMSRRQEHLIHYWQVLIYYWSIHSLVPILYLPQE